MVNRNILATLAIITALSASYTLEASAAKQAQELQQILQTIKNDNKGVPLNPEIQSLSSKDQAFNQAELLDMCEVATKKLRGDDDIIASESYAQLNGMIKNLITELKDYKVSGFGSARHSSFNILYGKENFDFGLVFKNKAGEVLTQNFNLKYSSFGWQAQFVYRFDTIFVVNSDFSSFHARNPLAFNTGFTGGWRLPYTGPKTEVSAAQQEENFANIEILLGNRMPRPEGGFHDKTYTYPLTAMGVTVLPFTTAQGSLVIAHFGVGLTGLNACERMFSPNSFNLAIVPSGATLTPKAI